MFSPAASYVSGDSAPYTDELFIDIPENRMWCFFIFVMVLEEYE